MRDTLEKRFMYKEAPILYEIMTDSRLMEDFPGFVVRKVPYTGAKKELLTDLQLSAVDAVYTDINDDEILKAVLDMGIILYTMEPHEGFRKIRKFGRTVYTAGGFRHFRLSEAGIAFLDVAGGLVGITIFALLFIPLGVLIKLDSQGPILFRQERAGLNGRRFIIYKFRTMTRFADEHKDQMKQASNDTCLQMFKIKDDIRITRIGKYLRKTSLDEFPQFINVLKGDMSIVGTRPPTIDEIALYTPRHKARLATRPGITGVWQVSGRNAITDFEKVVEMDMDYVKKRGPFRYMAIIFKTIAVCLNKEGE